MKFGRVYQMMVTDNKRKQVFIDYPLTLDFSITHNIFAQANHAEFNLYNLKASSRSDISFSQYFKKQSYPVTLNAGYISTMGGVISSAFGPTPRVASAAFSSLPQIFNGYANVAYTERNGDDLVTRISALDNGDVTGNVPSAYISGDNPYNPRDIPFDDVVLKLMSFLKDTVKPGIVKVTHAKKPKTITQNFAGNVWELLQGIARPLDAYVYIENGVCNMLGPNDTLPAVNLGTLSASTGLLNIPKYTDTYVVCSCIFEPLLRIGATIKLESSVLPSLIKNPYRIVAYTHHGTISGVKSGDLISDITLTSLASSAGPG